MRITDVLRARIRDQLDLVPGCDGSRLSRVIARHDRTMQPVLDLLGERLGEGGFLAVLRLDRGGIERDLGRLDTLRSSERARRIRLLAARFADHLAICLDVVLPVADQVLTEAELTGLAERREAGEENLLERGAPPARRPGTPRDRY